MSTTELQIWNDIKTVQLSSKLATSPSEVISSAVQLRDKERQQIVSALNSGSYEIATSYILNKSLNYLKKELSVLGISFLAEMLERQDIDDDDNIYDVITDKEAIRLASELGVLSPYDALKMRHAYDLVSYFSQGSDVEIEEEMQQVDAFHILYSCTISILSKENVNVSTEFKNFKYQLENSNIQKDSQYWITLQSSPYFYKRLALTVLLSGIRGYSGAQLENCLANFNTILPLLWKEFKDKDKWQIGNTYSQVYNEGLAMQASGMKKALVQVQGFDFVPETLRSQTFISAAEKVIKAHDGMDNFFTEKAPMEQLANLGSSLPIPALGACITATLCVFLGNMYGYSWSAEPIAQDMLKTLSRDRVSHYINNYIETEVKILNKLTDDKPIQQWLSLFSSEPFSNIEIKNKNIAKLIEYSASGKRSALSKEANRLIRAYYSKP